MIRIVPFLLLGLCTASSLKAACLSCEKPATELTIERRADSGACSILSSRQLGNYRGLDSQTSHVIKLDSQEESETIRIVAHTDAALWSQAHTLCSSITSYEMHSEDILPNDPSQHAFSLPHASLFPTPKLEIEPLLQTGSSSNRVDLVFFSDGYTQEEKTKFIEDAKRLAEDVSNNQTFNTVRPLLNFWAAFTPSNESGIGVGGKPKNTTYGLYRDGTELRGVYYSKPAVARAACRSMREQCDYPILMGNDPLYGGLGGEFTVITPSLANGALVLRHELGHSIIEVGEEYDGGFAYFGPNAASDLSEPVPWAHWLTNPSAHSHKAHVERSVMPMQTYPWTMLNSTTPWSVRFNSSGQYPRHLVRFSLSGLPNVNDLNVTIDGEQLNWSPRKDIGVDRWHYDIHRNSTLEDGEHEVKFELKNKDREGVAQLCSAEILEFGTDDEFVREPGYHGIFPTFSETNTTTYRPTNEDCLMRIVTTPNFCKACLEGLWHSLLRRVDLIDDIVTDCEIAPGFPTTWKRTLDLKLVPLAQFRDILDLHLGRTAEGKLFNQLVEGWGDP
ncbi:hypothetical protein QCA50_006471 [Cerrena zonata]|uniref:IgA peptidase M64-domain-containing protein n=1 Tax=Cerrena zonata TaxID=2478898 RepID=A0AAW0GIV5_9APHY